jgi:hypothetical protein
MVATDVTVDLGDPDAPCTWSIDTGCCDCWDALDPDKQEAGIQYAALTLWAATGRRYGACQTTVRPCGKTCTTDGSMGYYWYDGIWRPYILGGVWRNCWCGGGLGCTCEPDCQVYLPGPVLSVSNVTVDGLVVPGPTIVDGIVTDPGEWRVDNKQWLVRTSEGDCWPTCQDYNVDSGDNTMFVTYMKGVRIPAALAGATGTLACEFAKACSGQVCRLPNRLSTIARQGVQLTFVNIDNLLAKGLTGITEVDQVITALNPAGLKRPMRVFSPDLPVTRQVTYP